MDAGFFLSSYPADVRLLFQSWLIAETTNLENDFDADSAGLTPVESAWKQLLTPAAQVIRNETSTGGLHGRSLTSAALTPARSSMLPEHSAKVVSSEVHRGGLGEVGRMRAKAFQILKATKDLAQAFAFLEVFPTLLHQANDGVHSVTLLHLHKYGSLIDPSFH